MNRGRPRLLEYMPPQHGEGDVCVECGANLSTYNPYVYCGPCRMKLSVKVYVTDNEDIARTPFPWEMQGGRRAVVRYGPLLEEAADDAA